MERKSQLGQSVESAASIYQLDKLNNFIPRMFWLCSEVVCEPVVDMAVEYYVARVELGNLRQALNCP